jgi:hypothetical protein
MGLINVSIGDDPDALFARPEYKIPSKGKHLFVVANKLEVTDSSTGASDVIKCEFRCQDEDENKGAAVWHNFVFIKNPQTDGDRKSIEINNAQLAQFCVACGVKTVEEIKAGENFDLDDFEGEHFEADVRITNEPVYPQELDDDGNPIKARKASIKQFLFEPEKTEE